MDEGLNKGLGLKSTIMQSPHRKYKVRSGTIDLGKEYEFKMVALLSLRCLFEDAEEIWIASNADSVGAFDDIIFHIRTAAKEDSMFMLQLKHKETPKNITEQELLSTKGDFSLQKYCNDICKLKLSLDSPAKNLGVLGELGDFNDINFVLFTNRGVNEYGFLDRVCDSSELSILNTNKSGFNAYRFNLNKLSCDTNINSDNCNNLYLISNQVHAKHLNKEIFAEIEKIVGKFQLTHVNVKFIVEKFVKYITEWAKGNLGGHYYLTKQDLCWKLSELLLYQYDLDLSCEEYAFHEEDEEHVWNKIICNKFLTIVDADDYVLMFLKLYVGSMVRKYIRRHDENLKLWTEGLSEHARNLFYQENDSLKIQMLKIVGNHGKITLLDIYKCLWLHNKLPLLLEANNEQQFKNITQILKLSNYGFKVIVINKGSLMFPRVENTPRHFITLQDLNSEERHVILDQPVKFQGRASTALRKLIDSDMLDEIKSKDVIYILSGDFNIGNRYEPVSDYFVERILSKILIKPEALTSVSGEMFLIKKSSDMCAMDELELANVDGSGNLEQVEKFKAGGKVIHRLVLCDGYLEWKETFGSIKNIRQYRLEEAEDLGEEEIDVEGLIKDNVLNTTRIISASPGMGKSTLLDYVATQVSDRWVLRVDLNDHHEYYETIKRRRADLTAFDHLMYFNDWVFEKHNRKHAVLGKLVFRKFLSSKNVLVLLDGFDEISICYKEEVTKIAKCLHDEGYHMWITTRPIMKSYLEEQLNTLAVTLQPFTIHDQVYFLTKYFTQISENSAQESIVVNFVIKLLKAAQINLSDGCLEFTGVPLQTLLLADVFSEELKTSLSTGVVSLNDAFDLLYLYEEFINRKIEIFCGKFGVGSKNMHALLKKHQQLFALKYLFDEDSIRELDVNRELEEYYEENQKLDFLQLEGVLVVHQSNEAGERFNVGFVHRTFAEYLAALWLAENVGTKDVTVKKCVKVLLDQKFRFANYFCPFLFKIFDCILGKNHKAHLAVIHGQTDELKAMIRSNPDVLDVVDAGGRTILHMMAMYGINYSNCFDVTDIEDKMSDIVEEIPSGKITDTKDFVLGYSALDYAVANCSLAVANKICEKSQALTVRVSLGLREQYFQHCATLGFKSLFKALLLHFAREHVLHWRYLRNKTVEEFCTVDALPDLKNRCLWDFASDFGAATLWDLFRFEDMNDVRFTAAYGSKDLLRLLLSKGARINDQDIYCNTALHYAVFHERLDMVRLLICAGAEIDGPGKNGCTALHYAAEDGYDGIVKELLRKGADINKQNNEGNTPLHFAVKNDETDTAKLLLARGAKTDVRNNKGTTPLHRAAKNGNNKLVGILIRKTVIVNGEYSSLPNGDSTESFLCNNASINCRNKNGETALHSSVRRPLLCDNEDVHHYQATVSLLLANGADVNAQDCAGNTALHYISKSDTHNEECMTKLSKYVVELFLKGGANVNLKNRHGQTALDLVIANRRSEIVLLLRQKSNAQAEVSLEASSIHENDEQIAMEALCLNCALF